MISCSLASMVNSFSKSAICFSNLLIYFSFTLVYCISLINQFEQQQVVNNYPCPSVRVYQIGKSSQTTISHMIIQHLLFFFCNFASQSSRLLFYFDSVFIFLSICLEMSASAYTLGTNTCRNSLRSLCLLIPLDLSLYRLVSLSISAVTSCWVTLGLFLICSKDLADYFWSKLRLQASLNCQLRVLSSCYFLSMYRPIFLLQCGLFFSTGSCSVSYLILCRRAGRSVCTSLPRVFLHLLLYLSTTARQLSNYQSTYRFQFMMFNGQFGSSSIKGSIETKIGQFSSQIRRKHRQGMKQSLMVEFLNRIVVDTISDMYEDIKRAIKEEIFAVINKEVWRKQMSKERRVRMQSGVMKRREDNVGKDVSEDLLASNYYAKQEVYGQPKVTGDKVAEGLSAKKKKKWVMESDVVGLSAKDEAKSGSKKGVRFENLGRNQCGRIAVLQMLEKSLWAVNAETNLDIGDPVVAVLRGDKDASYWRALEALGDCNEEKEDAFRFCVRVSGNIQYSGQIQIPGEIKNQVKQNKFKLK